MNNVGVIDRALRIFVGLALVLIAARNSDTGLVYAGILGLILLATGVFGWCAIYQLLGWSTKLEPSGSEQIDNDDVL